MAYKKEYALYKGDTFLAMGTIKEIAEKMGKTEDALRFYHTPAYKRRNYKNGYVLINVEVEE